MFLEKAVAEVLFNLIFLIGLPCGTGERTLKLGRISAFLLLILTATLVCGQTEPNLETGFKPYGSYHGSDTDSVSLMSGNLTIHIPMGPSYPQRGGRLDKKDFLVANSKTFSIQTTVNNNGTFNYWTPGGWSPGTLASGDTLEPAISRTYIRTSENGKVVSRLASGYTLIGWDGAQHPLSVGAQAGSGVLLAAETADATGWHLDLTAADIYNVPSSGILRDREGNQYVVQFGSDGTGICNTSSNTSTTGFTSSQTICQQGAGGSQIIDGNGNVFNAVGRSDTLGHVPVFTIGSNFSGPETSDISGCVSTGGLVLTGSTTLGYPGPGGTTAVVKICYANLTLQTSFGLSGVLEYPSGFGVPPQPISVAVAILNADGSKWLLSYDSYGNITSLGLPLGGTISYQWQTVSFPGCTVTTASRAVSQRTITDNNGNSSTWKYQWLTAQANPLSTNGTFTNVVTDPEGNDSVHVFTNYGTCSFYETTTQDYQGLQSAARLLKQVAQTG